MNQGSPLTTDLVTAHLRSPALNNLHRDLLYLIVENLDPVSLINLSCCCKSFRAFGTDSKVWASLAKRRWRDVNTLPYTPVKATQGIAVVPASSRGSGSAQNNRAETVEVAAGSTAKSDSSSNVETDWRRLFARENGWNGGFGVACLGDSFCGFCLGLHLFKSSDLGWTFPGGNLENELIIATISGDGQDWVVGWTLSSTPPKGKVRSQDGPYWAEDVRTQFRHLHEYPGLTGPVLALPDKPLVAIGAASGTVCLAEPHAWDLRSVRHLHTGNPEYAFATPSE